MVSSFCETKHRHKIIYVFSIIEIGIKYYKIFEFMSINQNIRFFLESGGGIWQLKVYQIEKCSSRRLLDKSVFVYLIIDKYKFSIYCLHTGHLLE